MTDLKTGYVYTKNFSLALSAAQWAMLTGWESLDCQARRLMPNTPWVLRADAMRHRYPVLSAPDMTFTQQMDVHEAMMREPDGSWEVAA